MKSVAFDTLLYGEHYCEYNIHDFYEKYGMTEDMINKLLIYNGVQMDDSLNIFTILESKQRFIEKNFPYLCD